MRLDFIDLGDVGLSFTTRYRRSYGRINSLRRAQTITLINTVTETHSLGHYDMHLKAFTLEAQK